jgi:hypothetical protein
LTFVLHLRLVVPSDRVDDVCDLLTGSDVVTNVVRFPGAAIDPAGDVVLANVARESASGVIEALRERDLERLGSISAYEVTLSLSDRARAAEEAAPGHGTDAVVWEEVEARTT